MIKVSNNAHMHGLLRFSYLLVKESGESRYSANFYKEIAQRLYIIMAGETSEYTYPNSIYDFLFHRFGPFKFGISFIDRETDVMLSVMIRLLGGTNSERFVIEPTYSPDYIISAVRDKNINALFYTFMYYLARPRGMRRLP